VDVVLSEGWLEKERKKNKTKAKTGELTDC